MTIPCKSFCVSTLFLLLIISPLRAADYSLRAPEIVHKDAPFQVIIEPAKVVPELPPHRVQVRSDEGIHSDVLVSDSPVTIPEISLATTGEKVISMASDGAEIGSRPVRVIHGWMSVLPPVIAIAVALVLRSVIPAIFLGLWIGVYIQNGFTAGNLLVSLLDSFQVHVLAALVDEGHASIILFSCMIGGMVGIISKNGGMLGIINFVTRWASTPKRGQLSVWILGLCIFFDDYINTLVVGNSVRPVTDKLKISREKLAYIVDSTAAPVACIALVTTWIGYEVGLIGESIRYLPGIQQSAYEIFLHSILYSFYPLLAIFFVFLVAWSGRDFGPMRVAEKRSYSTGEVAPAQKSTLKNESENLDVSVPVDIPRRALNAVIPILVLVGGCIVSLYVTGEGETLRSILSTADSYKALMWASIMSVAVAIFMTLAQRLMNLQDVITAWTGGVYVMIAPMIILVLAWALSGITDVLGTADYLVRLGGDTLSPQSIPAWTFVLAALTAFATGTSWGVMAILLPLLVPFCWATMDLNGIANQDHYYLIHSTVACVLAGAVWGDHCSPISDTTVLSSMATNCDHIEHVRTQIPYALTVGAVALVVGIIPSAHALPWWLSLLAAAIILTLCIYRFGKKA